ncbi:MAG TPA: indolepyruvate ferredoxin oxidoreductase subunit alpha [Syntrophales bacterium]|nr:indolepyruvate ferredoxin oxidoreductase subunit alpha [Syntrophales bacterium]HOL58529.1 indolepyruvate ferredoxin oxidoreductase subunit alpha [Syntrophales bacterium]
MKALLSGNEAIARGAYECGVRFAAGYPGTPSTEILEEFSRYEGVYAEWSPNEKVALEVGIGAALAGEKALVTMKHVGLNVAADPLFTVSYTGINGALVIVSADDPSMHSSQNEQDNRNYAKFAKVPLLEPADSEEASRFVKLAFALSKEFDTPVILRTTTRVSHSKGIVELKEPEPYVDNRMIELNAAKYVMVPAMARQRRLEVEKRMQALKAFAETFPENRLEMANPEIGIITAGMCYNYAKSQFPDFSYLKLGMVHPLPVQLIRDFASRVKRIYVIEELDPFIEEQVKALGIEVMGKERFPYTGEFDPGIVYESITGKKIPVLAPPDVALPPRPPNLCPGCPHRGLFYILGKLKVFVTGDIGCYTLAFMKPLEGLHSCICMGASIGMAHGMSQALKEKGRGKIVGVIGDSTFLHSGIPPLMNVAYNKGEAVIVICDNRTTAMTGMQDHPGTGFTLQGAATKAVSYEALGKVLGLDSVRVVDPYNLEETERVLKEELNRPGSSLVISRRACVLYRREGERKEPFWVAEEKCIGCRRCLDIGCPALSWIDFSGLPEGSYKKVAKKQKGRAVIDPDACTGCSVCAQLCKSKAIVQG